MTSPDKMATGGSDVTASISTSQSGDAGYGSPEMKRTDVGSEVGQLIIVTPTSSSVSIVSTASATMQPSSRVSAGREDRHAGNGSRNPNACGWLKSIGRRRQKPEEFRPTSTGTELTRARTVGPISSRSSYDAAVDSRTPVTVTAGVYSTHLRKAAAANGTSRSSVSEVAADRSSLLSPSAATVDCRPTRSDAGSVSGEASLLHGPVRSFATFPGRSSHGAASSTVSESSTAKTNSRPVQLETVENTELSISTVVSGPRRSVISGSDCCERTAVKSTTTLTTVNSYSIPSCCISARGG